MATSEITAGRRDDRPQFDTPSILWFFGAFIATAASLAIVNDVHPGARGLWILLVSLVFLAAYLAISAWLLALGWIVPGGILASLAVLFVPAAGVGVERLLGVWDAASAIDPFQSFDGSLFALALVTILAGFGMFVAVGFPFVFAIVAGATLLATQLFAPVFSSGQSPADHATSLLVAGLGLLVVGILFDLRDARRTAFWWHLIGLQALTIGLAYHAFSHASWGWLLILVAGVVVLVLSVPLRRATWGVFGVAGTFAPIAHYVDSWFGTLGAAFGLGAVGLALVGLGMAHRAFGETWAASISRLRPVSPETRA